MKIGLLTFHSAQNYGGVLQAYATQEVVKALGHEIQIIDYRPPYLIKQKFFPGSKGRPLSIKIKILIEGMLCLYWRYKRRKGFNTFINLKLNLSQKKYWTKAFSPKDFFDAFIMGSDQIWNIKLTHGFDDAYWGNFRTKNHTKKVSYAASMSNYLLNVEQKQIMSHLLSNFHAISVREEELKKFLYDTFKIEATTVLDPTFLLESTKWQMISIRPRINKKYVLVYTISLRDDVIRIAKSVAKQLNAVIIELTIGVDKNVVYNKYQVATPEEFLGLFENAECILTSSFHGTTFSIIFNKQFYSVAHDTDKDTRQTTILEKLGLLDRFISRNSTPDFEKIDYKDVNPKLEILRKESIAFLKNNLSDKQSGHSDPFENSKHIVPL